MNLIHATASSYSCLTFTISQDGTKVGKVSTITVDTKVENLFFRIFCHRISLQSSCVTTRESKTSASDMIGSSGSNSFVPDLEYNLKNDTI